MVKVVFTTKTINLFSVLLVLQGREIEIIIKNKLIGI